MSKRKLEIKRFAGIADSDKEGLNSQFLWGRSVDYRTDPNKLKILPRTQKSSGSVVTDLPMWADRQDTDVWLYGNSGNIYKKDNSDTWSLEHSVSNSQGNGFKYFGEDGYLYYMTDTALGRYGPFKSTEANTFVDDFLGAEGGVPLNTHSLVLNGTSQYATAADSASLSQTGDLSLGISAKIDSLPAVGDIQTLMAKWNENGNQRSFSLGIKGISGYFGDGSDGALTISSNTTQSPVDASCSGSQGTYSLSATNASFAAGQKLLIHQSRGSSSGYWERNEIASYSAGTITTTDPLDYDYSSSGSNAAQVIVLKEYTNVTVDAGDTWSAKTWNGSTGGILAFLASGTVTINGTISANGKGYRGGDGVHAYEAYQGEGYPGMGADGDDTSNGNGGGAGSNYEHEGGGGGGNGTAGQNGVTDGVRGWAKGGEAVGTADLTTMFFGGGGGAARIAGGHGDKESNDGGNGGGIIFISGVTLDVNGNITSNGTNGQHRTDIGDTATGGGGGAGGSILLKSQDTTLGSNLIKANGGDGGEGLFNPGGDGGEGRIHLDYYTSYSGTTDPTLDVTQDDNLVTTASYQLQLALSDDGTAEEFLVKTIEDGLNTSQWYRFGVTFDASASEAQYYVDGNNIGQAIGSMTSIYDSTAVFSIGARFDGSGNAENFLGGKVDDMRFFSDIRTSTEINKYKEVEIAGGTTGLEGYWQVDNNTNDETANANNLTLVDSPSYDETDVPFASPTTRNDIDQQNSTSGQTYTLQTSITESAAHKVEFTPDYDPQKSIEVNIDTVGTGDWTLTVHDGLNRKVAEKTISNGNLSTDDFEFTFDDEWRPVVGATYHFHLTSTVADGIVVTGSAGDLSTTDYTTYYQFLVDDKYHPVEQIENKLAIGNKRYLATWDGITYNSSALTLPSGYRVRCLGTWREYLAIGTTRGSNIFDYDQGKIFFWDGTSDTYNFYIDVPEGGINTIVSGDPLKFVAGYSGDLLEYSGGDARKLKRLPKITNKKYVEIAPGASTMWRSLTHIGYGLNTDSSEIHQGVYAFGRINERRPKTMSFDYPLSLGITQSTNLKIGLVFPSGSELLISWENNGVYGVDIVKPTNNPYPTATFESLITDLNKIDSTKLINRLRAYFKALESGDSFTLKYKIDREDSWNEGDSITEVGEKEGRMSLPAKGNRWNELQVGVNMATNNSASPEFYGIALGIEDLRGEQRI